MNNLSGSGVTNSLLALIAVLMLVLVIQNASKPTPSFGSPPMVSSKPSSSSVHSPMGSASGFHAHDHDSESEASPQDFNPTDMIYAALKCPSNPSLVLNEPSCQGADATQRKKVVDEAFNQGLTIPKIFDAVIEKFGEKALTDQAIQIRRAARRG